MKTKAKALIIIVIGLLLAVIPRFSAAIDAPHNASNNISCGDCHGATLLNSPFWGGSGSYDQLCLNCHRVSSGPYTETNAPLVKTHSSLTTSNKYGDWTWECRNCHDPHYQRQKNYKTTDASRLYLATGTITSCVYNGNGTSTLTYSTITYKSGCDCTKLTAKTGDYRRTVLFPNVNKLGYNYPVKAIDTGAKTITVSGDATAYLYPPTTFAAMYGQYVKDVMDVIGTDKTVKFFDHTGINSYADGNTTCDGICETCHTKTSHYKNDGSGSDQHHMNVKVGGEDGQKCSTCHSHTEGFKANCYACHGYPPGLNGGSLVSVDKDGNPVTSDSSGMGAHATHYTAGFVCINCHTGGMLQGAPQGDGLIDIGFNLNSTNLGGTYDGKTGRTVFPYVAGGSTTVTANGSLGCSNLYCHGSTLAPDGGTDTTPVWNDPSTGACGTCHGATVANPPTRGSHSIHAGSAGGGVQLACTACHSNYPTNHVNGSVNLQAGSGVNFSYTVGGACSNISCHNNTNAQWGTSACLNCHSMSLGNRAAITTQFSGNSHHVQGVMLTSAHCYQCHWEANSDGTINGIYHGGSGASAVDLVIYAAGTRPATYTSGTTAIQYTANGARTEIQKINGHCLSCHSDQNNSTTPFADGKTPKQYAWDGTSVAAKYSQTDSTTWGKYSGANITPKNMQTKAYSAHGNAINNQGGWDLHETWTNTRAGTVNVACFDCHNSHGSTASGTSTSYASATTNGGILKDTLASKGGYSLTYKPASGGSTDNKNAYNSGAGLCFDCHMTATSGTTPWGYNSTFGATQAIMGYWDTPYFGPGTFGSQSRYAYKASATHKGGHFGASSDLSGSPAGIINGLCTPCHDPHGVSPTLGTNQQYSVPLLKGTWLTSLYEEDVAPANNTTWTINDVNAGNVYHIDQNTFGSNIRDAVTGITQTDTQFASLCLTCHTKNSLTDGNNGGTWKSIDRIHESVKGWGANAKHKYPCSKCHATHNSRLPRLMVTNCLNSNHKGRVSFNPSPVLSGNGCGYDEYEGGDGQTGGPFGDEGPGGGCGSGSFPGSSSGGYAYGNHTVTCHENQSADQSWNNRTPWMPPTLTSPTATGIGSNTAILGANVTSNGGSALTARGTVWGTAAGPTGNALAEGGTTTGVFSHARSSLTDGTKIYYRGYATNSVGTGYSPDGSFYTEPPTQASGVNFSSVGDNGMTVNWTRGNGDGVIVLIHAGSAVSSDPADGTYTGYTANAVFGSGTPIGIGNYVIYKGTGASVTVTGLTAGTTYFVAIYEYKGTADTSGVNQGTNYKPSPATGSQTTNLIVPTLTSPTATSIGSNTAILGANVTSNGGSALTARGTVWGTAAGPTGNALAEGGTTTGVFSHARSSLTDGTKIYYRGYATNSVGTGYSPDGSFYTEPPTQASGVNFSSVGDNGMTVNWTRGNGDGVIVLIHAGSAVSSDPADGTYTGYTANAVFGSGTPIGIGNYVIYKGTGTSVAVTGLSGGTTYYVAVYEYKGTEDTSGVNQGTNYKPTPATGNQQTTVTGGSYSFTFNYTGSVQSLSIPSGATNIQFTVKGAGGGGGRDDSEENQESGQNGHSVVMSYSTSGVTLSIYVGGGGTEGSTEVWGASGGWGYHSGGAGGAGDDFRPYGYDDWGYGGAGGGGSSAILSGGSTLLAEAAGGAGGRSSDWDGTGGCDPGYCENYTYGGPGGAGGGSDYPSPGTTGGGTGGGTATPGGLGQVVITYDY